MAHTEVFDRRAPRAIIRSCLAAAILWVAAAVDPPLARAQLPSLVELSAQYAPPAELDGAAMRAQISSYQLALNVPIPLSGGRILIPSVSYHLDAVALQQASVDGTTHTMHHAPELGALLVQLLPGRWSVSLRASASLAGEFETIDRRMMRASALALVSKTFSDRLTVGVGALATAGFGAVQPLPAVSLHWRPVPELHLETFVPAFASARYVAWNRVELGARVELTGNVYAIRDAGTRERWPCAAQSADDPATAPDESMASASSCFDHVTYTVGSAGLVAGVRLASTVWLTAFGGVSFYRRAEHQNRDNVTLPGGAQDLPRALFVRTSLAWRLPGS